MKKISANTITFILLVLVFILRQSWIPAVITGTAAIISIIVDIIKRNIYVQK